MIWISRFYMLFLGILLSVTTGFGIGAFYPQPVRPTYPSSRSYYSYYSVPANCNQTVKTQNLPECQKAFQKHEQIRQENETAMNQYKEDNAVYTRTTVFFGILIGSIFAIIGLVLIKTSKFVAQGLLLAGILTAILTRLLIALTSLGASVTGTQGADTIGYLEFAILFALSTAVVFIGLSTLKEDFTRVAK